MKITYSLIGLMMLISTGCATTQAVKTDNSIGSAVNEESCKPITYKKSASSAKERPPWVLVSPEDEKGMHYLIGMSGYNATERDARDDAMRHAREEFAKYTG